MSPKHTLRDSRLIDGLEILPHKPFEATIWRVVRDSRDPLQCSASGGRWDDSSFDVLYTSLERNGAIAEMYFHLLRGQPVFPSKIRYKIYELNVSLLDVITLTIDDLTTLGLDGSRFGQLSYNERAQEYPRSQEIAEVAHFLDCDGIVVPNARWDCANLVLFCDRLKPDATEVIRDHGLVDWLSWQNINKQ